MAAHHRHRITLPVFTLAALLAAPASQALTASAEASIDWSGLTLDFLSGAGTLSPSSSDVQTWHFDAAGGVSPSPSDFAADWSTPLLVELASDNGATDVVAASDGDALRASARVDSALGLPQASLGDYGAQASRAGTLEALEDGMLLLTVPYSVSVSSDAAALQLSSDVWLWAWISNSADGSYAGYDAYAGAWSDPYSGAVNGADSGLLSLALPLEAGDRFDLSASASVSVYAPVPLPPLAWLLGVCLATVLGARRASSA